MVFCQKGCFRDSNLILFQSPRFSCYIDMVLDVKYGDHLVEQYLSKSLHSGSYILKWVSVRDHSLDLSGLILLDEWSGCT